MDATAASAAHPDCEAWFRASAVAAVWRSNRILDLADTTCPDGSHVAAVKGVVCLTAILVIRDRRQTIHDLPHHGVEVTLDSFAQGVHLLLKTNKFLAEDHLPLSIILDIVEPVLFHLFVKSFETALKITLNEVIEGLLVGTLEEVSYRVSVADGSSRCNHEVGDID